MPYIGRASSHCRLSLFICFARRPSVLMFDRVPLSIEDYPIPYTGVTLSIFDIELDLFVFTNDYGMDLV